MTDDKGLVDAYSSIYKKEEEQLDEIAITGSILAAKAAMGAMKGAKVLGGLSKAAKVAGKVQSVADAAGSVGDAANKIRGKGQHHPSQNEEVEVVAEKKKDWGTGSKQRFKTKERKAQEREDIAIEKMLGMPKRKKPTKDYPFNDRYEEVEPVNEVAPAVVAGAKLAGKAALAGVASEVGSQVVKKIKGGKKEVKKEEVEGGVSVVDYDSEYTPTEIETVDIIDAPKMKGTEDLHETEEALEERLWDQVAANLTTLGEMRGVKYQVSPFEEEVENLDELSKKTLGSYISKASSQLRSAAAKHGRDVTLGKPIEYRKKKDSDKKGNFEKMHDREMGIKQAAEKITKEEFNVRSPLTFSKKEEPQVDVSELEEKYACSTKKAHKRLKK